MRVVILAGGMGTRLQEETVTRPKPMVEIGGMPILWHIMKHFRSHGFRDFVIALGYMGDFIKQFFLNRYNLSGHVSIDFATGQIERDEVQREDWRVSLIDTGLHTNTGGRVKRLQPWLSGEPFIVTYGDGLSNVDVRALVRFHRRHGKLATVTAVRPPARFGGLVLDGDPLPVSPRSRRPAKAGSTADFWCLSRGSLIIWAATTRVWSRTRWSDWRPKASWPPISTPISGSAWTRCATRTTWRDCGERSRPWRTWDDRPESAASSGPRHRKSA